MNCISLMMDQSEAKHVGENIIHNNRLYICCIINVFCWDLIKKVKQYAWKMQNIKRGCGIYVLTNLQRLANFLKSKNRI